MKKLVILFIITLAGCAQTNILNKYECTLKEGSLAERFTKELSFELRTSDNIIFNKWGEFEIIERIYDTTNYTLQYMFSSKSKFLKGKYATYDLITNKFHFGEDNYYCETDLNTNQMTENCDKYEASLIDERGELWSYTKAARYFVYEFIECQTKIEYNENESKMLTKEDEELNKLIEIVTEEIKKGNIK